MLYSQGICVVEDSLLGTNHVGVKPGNVNKQCDFTESSESYVLFFFFFKQWHLFILKQTTTTNHLNVLLAG